MANNEKEIYDSLNEDETYSFWMNFRIVFVIFSIYLMTDIFYRWDGFKYYGSLSEYIPSVALAAILWTGIAAVFSTALWLFILIINKCFPVKAHKLRIEHMLVFICIFIVLVDVVWKANLLAWRYILLIKELRFLVVLFAAVGLTVLLRNKAVQWIRSAQSNITPLVGLFSALVLVSIPVVILHASRGGSEGIQGKTLTSTKADIERPNIILVTFDALTARNMSVYDYDRETTPFISKWAKSASVFNKAQAISNYTSPTTATLMTGKRMWTHQLYQPHGYKIVNAEKENFPQVLRDAGYYNLALVQNTLASVRKMGITESFDVAPYVVNFIMPSSIGSKIEKELFLLFGNTFRIHNWLSQPRFIFGFLMRTFSLGVTVTEYPAEAIFDRFLQLTGNNMPEPYFAWLHLFPPHDPSLPPSPFMGMFNPSHRFRSDKTQWTQKVHDPLLARARYDEYIRYCDQKFKELISRLGENNNSVIVLSADHGHSFEHGYTGNHGGNHLYETLTNIPLIIKVPGSESGIEIDQVVEQVDIPATMLDLAGLSVPSWMEGKSLVPLMKGEELLSEPQISMVLEETESGGKILQGTFAVWEGDYKLIHYLKPNMNLLFNLKNDPEELVNLSDKEPERVSRLVSYIKDKLASANEDIHEGNKKE